MSWVPLAGGGADLERQRVVLDGTTQRLTTKERDLLAHFAARPGATVTRGELLMAVWKLPARASEDPVYSAIKRLRAKIDRGAHQHVVSVHGDGYRWVPPRIVAIPKGVVTVTAASPRNTETPDAPTQTAWVGSADRFFGRVAERAAATAALAARRGVVSLVGPGGVGKTRLALEVARGQLHVLCDLSSALDEAATIACIASALEVPLAGPDASAFSRAIRHALAAAPDRIVILDNVEQVTEPVAQLVATWADVLPPTLVTSREPLRVRGEQVIAMGPLPIEEAIALFDDRLAASGGGTSDPATSQAIVLRVDYLPLAIELAAAQAPSIGVAALLDSLGDSLGTLVAGRRDAPPRQRTLRAAVEWSWAFLSTEERTALVSLATFEGSFDLDAALAVIARNDAPALLATLCRRSQARRERDRFQLYSAVRELSRERSTGDGAEARHAAHYAAVGSRCLAMLEGPQHAEGAARLDREVTELRAALERSLKLGAPAAIPLARSLEAGLAQRGGDLDLRRTLLRRAGEIALRPEDRAALRLAEGTVPGAPPELLEEALALALATKPRDSDDSASGTEAGAAASCADSDAAARAALRAEAGLAMGRRIAAHDPAEARRVLLRALDEAVAGGAERTRGRITASLGESAWLEGAVAEARRLLREGLATHERVRDDRAIARTAALLAHLDRLESGDGSASELLRRATESAHRLGDPLVTAQVALDRGQHLTRIGDQAGARAALDEATRSYARLGFNRERALTHLHLTEALLGVGQLDEALEAAQRALADLDEGDVACSTVHEAIACVHLLAGRMGPAGRWIESGLALARSRGAARSECTLLGKRGLLHLGQGNSSSAWTDFDDAVNKNEARGSTAITGASLVDRAMAALAGGRIEDAEADLERARILLRDPGEERPEGRMLVVCEAAGRAFAAVAGGARAADVERRLRSEMARFFDQVPESEWDLVLRFLDWLIGRVARVPSRLGDGTALRLTRGRATRRSRR